MFNWTFLVVFLNSHLTFEQSITQTTGKLFEFSMYWMMLYQFSSASTARKVKPVWIYMKQETMEFWNGSGISGTICKQSAPHSRQITTCAPTPHHSIFTGWMLFMTTNQQRQSTEGIVQCGIKHHTLRSSEHASWCKWHICNNFYTNHTNSLTSVIQKCLRSTSDLRSLVRGRNSVFTTVVVQDKQKVVTWLRRSPVIIRGQKWLDLVTDTTLSASQHNTSYTMFNWTFLEVSLNVLLMFVQSIT